MAFPFAAPCKSFNQSIDACALGVLYQVPLPRANPGEPACLGSQEPIEGGAALAASLRLDRGSVAPWKDGERWHVLNERYEAAELDQGRFETIMQELLS